MASSWILVVTDQLLVMLHFTYFQLNYRVGMDFDVACNTIRILVL
jgi:hypothetical protein